MFERLASSFLVVLAVLSGPVPSAAQDRGVAGPGGSAHTSAVAAVLRAPAADSAELAAGMETLEEALRLAREGEHVAAAEHFVALGDYLPTLRDWTPLLAAESLAEAGDTAGVRARLAELAPDSEVSRRWAWLSRARALEMADAPEAALAMARGASHEAWDDRSRSLVYLRIGELSVAVGDESGARTAFLEAMEAGRGGRYGIRAADALSRVPDIAPAEQVEIARIRVLQGEWRVATAGLEAGLGLEGLSESDRNELRLDLGRAYFYAHRYVKAERTLSALVEDSTASEAVAARALYFVGRSAYRQGRKTEGRSTLESVADRFSTARAARDALYLLADLDHDAGRLSDARAYYQGVLDLAPESSTATLAGIRLGAMQYLEGEYGEAAKVFDGRVSDAGQPAARQQAAYWAGLSYEALGQSEAALARFQEAYEFDPLSYYGAQSASRVGGALLSEDLQAGPDTPGAEAMRDELANAVVRLRVHLKVPTPGSFAFELQRLDDHFAERPGGRYGLAEALIEGGLPVQGILLGRELQREGGGWNVRLLRIVYPFPHRDVILREAEFRNVNPYFAAGLIRQESMFDEDIESRAGAIGIMQVMPATGRELARGVGIERYSTTRLTEAEVNVRLGMTFLSEMLRRYDGEVLDALVAYNAGPTRIRRWRGLPEYRDADVFVERIPFRETRQYVKVVQRNAMIYESLYGCEGGQPCLGEPPPTIRALVGAPSEAQAALR